MRVLFSLMIRLLLILSGFTSLMLFMITRDNGEYQAFDRGFAVDSHDNVYVGNPRYIYVYSPEGKVIDKISAHTSRGYYFTVKDDLLYVTDLQKVHIIDLSGNIVTTLEYSYENFPFLYNIDYDSFVDPDMNEYSMKTLLGRKIIVRSGESADEVILKMPLQSYCILLFVGFSCAVATLSALSIIYQIKYNKL